MFKGFIDVVSYNYVVTGIIVIKTDWFKFYVIA